LEGATGVEQTSLASLAASWFAGLSSNAESGFGFTKSHELVLACFFDAGAFANRVSTFSVELAASCAQISESP